LRSSSMPATTGRSRRQVRAPQTGLSARRRGRALALVAEAPVARDLDALLLEVLGRVAVLELQVALRRQPGRQLAPALALGVELLTEEHRQVRDPQPYEQRDRAAQRAVGLVVGAEVGDVEAEGRGGD